MRAGVDFDFSPDGAAIRAHARGGLGTFRKECSALLRHDAAEVVGGVADLLGREISGAFDLFHFAWRRSAAVRREIALGAGDNLDVRRGCALFTGLFSGVWLGIFLGSSKVC